MPALAAAASIAGENDATLADARPKYFDMELLIAHPHLAVAAPEPDGAEHGPLCPCDRPALRRSHAQAVPGLDLLAVAAFATGVPALHASLMLVAGALSWLIMDAWN
ncbi:hypothetical protein [Ancylobacter sp. IITR112]|uniref:hypothetical protein n=1 Tax=Ancylobacter sp. IITR112 TaxID=3138073 RepID=UPI00352A4502